MKALLVNDRNPSEEVVRPTGVGTVVVRIIVERGEMLRQRHAEEISGAANFTRAFGTARALRLWT
jgi:hypothetical protein